MPGTDANVGVDPTGGWAKAVSDASDLLSGIIGIATAKTECGQKCRIQCQQSNPGILFSGREKCKKACMAKCNEPPPPPPSGKAIAVLIVGGLLALGIVIGLVYLAVKVVKRRGK